MTSTAVDGTYGEPTRLRATPRGRHRRPRPRKMLFAAGGLALAAGMLSLVRMSSDPGGVAGIGTAEAEPRPDPVMGADTDTDTDSGTDRATGVGAPVAATPTAPSALGRATTGTAPGARLVPGTPGSPTSVALTPGATYTPAPPGPTPAPAAARVPAPTPAPSRTAAPRPTSTPPPAPAPTTASPAATQQPGQPGRPGLCVPVVGLCVDPLNAAPRP